MLRLSIDKAAMAIDEHAFVDSQGHKIFYLAAGPQDGPLLIFCHGWPAIAATWTCQLETFANLGFRAVAPDMPGESRPIHRHSTQATERVDKYMCVPH